MHVRLVREIEGHWLTEEFPYANIDEAMAIRGFEPVGYESNPSRRRELQGKPKYDGLAGPMFDGEGWIRYEAWSAYRALSQ